MSFSKTQLHVTKATSTHCAVTAHSAFTRDPRARRGEFVCWALGGLERELTVLSKLFLKSNPALEIPLLKIKAQFKSGQTCRFSFTKINEATGEVGLFSVPFSLPSSSTLMTKLQTDRPYMCESVSRILVL